MISIGIVKPFPASIREEKGKSVLNIKHTVVTAVFVTAGIAGLSACGGSSASSGPPATAPAITAPAASAVVTPSTAGGLGQTLDSISADIQACTSVQKAYAAFAADKSQDNLSAFAASLAAVPGAAMTPSLFSAFQALDGDVQDAMISGSPDATSGADETNVANGCAAAGVPMPSGFTGD